MIDVDGKCKNESKSWTTITVTAFILIKVQAGDCARQPRCAEERALHSLKLIANVRLSTQKESVRMHPALRFISAARKLIRGLMISSANGPC